MAQKDLQEFTSLTVFMRITGIKRSRAEKLFYYNEDPATEKEYQAMVDFQNRIARWNNFVIKKPKP